MDTMDIMKELETAIEGIPCQELDSMLEIVLHDLLKDSNTPPLEPTPFPAEPPTNLLHQEPSNSLQTTAVVAAVPPAAPLDPCNLPVIPDSMVLHLRPVGELNGVPVYDYVCPAPPVSAPPPKKRKRSEQRDDDQPHVKKPPNAFMIFLKEQRQKVMAEGNIRGSAAVNAVVGERWKALSKDQKEEYFRQAEEQRILHALQHPDWSSRDNYGKKRKRVRGSTCSTV